LGKRQIEVTKEKAHIQRVAMMREVEGHGQAAIQKYGIDRCIKNPASRAFERTQQAEARRYDALATAETTRYGHGGIELAFGSQPLP